jgi:hypothetical protein
VKRFHLVCPSCGKTIEHTADAPPRINCGDCLMDRIEVVEFVVKELAAEGRG